MTFTDGLWEAIEKTTFANVGQSGKAYKFGSLHELFAARGYISAGPQLTLFQQAAVKIIPHRKLT